MRQKGLVPSEFMQQFFIRKPCITCVFLFNIGMSKNNAKTVTTRYRQKDLTGDILYERTPALPTCIGKSFICIVFTQINNDFCIGILYLQNNNKFMGS